VLAISGPRACVSAVRWRTTREKPHSRAEKWSWSRTTILRVIHDRLPRKGGENWLLLKRGRTFWRHAELTQPEVSLPGGVFSPLAERPQPDWLRRAGGGADAPDAG